MKHLPLPGNNTRPPKKLSHTPHEKNHARGQKDINRGITVLVHPTKLHVQIMNAVLMHINRFRIARAVDIASACFAERPYTAARQASRRALRGLREKGYVHSYRTEKHQTIYAMTDAGARYLERLGVNAKSSIRSAANMVNPVHTLWLNMLVTACEARGVEAYSESELQKGLNRNISKLSDKVRGILVVKAAADSATAILQPDLIGLEDDGVTWFEVDCSRRGPSRSSRFDALVRKIGEPLTALVDRFSVLEERAKLARVALLTDDILHLNRLRNRMLRLVADTAVAVLTADLGNVRFVVSDSEIFEVWRAVEREGGQVDICVGHVILQMLPTGLPNYQGHSPTRASPAGWFGENYLPYKRPCTLQDWPVPVSEFIRPGT